MTRKCSKLKALITSNATATFQHCMMAIFSDFIEDIIEIFMDDFLYIVHLLTIACITCPKC